MFLVIDNYDSFTFNLVQLFQILGEEVTVYRNDEITVDEVLQLSPQAVIISPGPCTPNESGVCLELTANILGRIPLLGVCLGLQVIGQHLGGKIITADLPFHGKTSFIEHDGHGIYQGISSPVEATRYHSLILDPLSVPTALIVTALTASGLIMGVRHKESLCEAVQFHPESIASPQGPSMMQNFCCEVTRYWDFKSSPIGRNDAIPRGNNLLI